MGLSIAGAVVFLALLLAGRLAGNAIIIGLFASIAFGSTAIASLPGVGSSSPLVYSAFEAALIAGTALQPNASRAFASLFREHLSASAASMLAIFAVASCLIFPRLFSGDLTVIMPVHEDIMPLRLAPMTAHLTQTAHLVSGILAFFCLRIRLDDERNLKAAYKGIMALCIANCVLGAIDFLGKTAGLGDLLEPIRTANYIFLIETSIGDFVRIAGGYSEASFFAISALASLSFTFTYWRYTRSALSLVLTLWLLTLLVLSTSSTAYVGLAAIGAVAALSMGLPLFLRRIMISDLSLLIGLLALLAGAVGLFLIDEHAYDPFANLIDTMVFNKAHSESAFERGYWDELGIRAFFDTYGLGTGMGTSRPSSSAIAVISQLGVFGSALLAALIVAVLKGAPRIYAPEQFETYALAAAARAMVVGWLVGMCISGCSADPGPPFYLGLAVVLGCKHYLVSRAIDRQRLASIPRPLVCGRMSA